MSNKIIFISPLYIQYRKMWKTDRWKFSGELVRLTIKQKKAGLDQDEQLRFDILQRVVNENNGKWTEGFNFQYPYKKVK